MNIINLYIDKILYTCMYTHTCFIHIHKGTCSLFHETDPSATENKKEKILFRLTAFGKILLQLMIFSEMGKTQTISPSIKHYFVLVYETNWVMSCSTIDNFTVFTTVSPFSGNFRVLRVAAIPEMCSETEKLEYWKRQGPTMQNTLRQTFSSFHCL